MERVCSVTGSIFLQVFEMCFNRILKYTKVLQKKNLIYLVIVYTHNQFMKNRNVCVVCKNIKSVAKKGFHETFFISAIKYIGFP